MKTTFNASMFESIKSALENSKTKTNGGPSYKEILSIDAPSTVLVRLLPNKNKPAETFLHYYHHGWNNVVNGKYVNIISPKTWGERCPISELYFKTLRDGSEEDIARAKANIRIKENWYVNVYVIQDPKNPENNGTVKILRYGRQLNKIIESAINGDDSAEFGAKIFDLSPNGCNLRIKAELVSDKPGAPVKYPTYVASKFLNPSPIEGLDDSKAEEVLNSVHDLNSFLTHNTAAEIEEFLNINYFGKDAAAPKQTAPVDNDDDVPYDTPKSSSVKPVVKQAVEVASDEVSVNDDKVKSILDGLDDL